MKKREEEWMEAYQQGDSEALDGIYRLLKQPLYSFVFRYTHDEQFSIDIVQDTFVKLQDHRHLSRENNFPELALETARLALTEAGVKVGTDAELTVASRDHASGMFAVRDGFDLIRRA